MLHRFLRLSRRVLFVALTATVAGTTSNILAAPQSTATSTSLTFVIPAIQGPGTSRFGVASDPTIQPFLAPGIPPGVGVMSPIDLQGNGRPDVLLCHVSSSPYPREKVPCRVLRPQPDGSVIDVTRQLFGAGALPSVENAREIVTGDFNQDGRPDIFIAAHGYDTPPLLGELNVLLISNADGTYTDRSSTLPQVPDYSHSACVGDINGDGHLDIYVGNLAFGFVKPPPYFLMGKGDGTFTQKASGLPPTVANSKELYVSCLIVDADLDGFSDLVLGQWSTGTTESIMLFNDGTGDFTGRPRYALPAGSFGSQNTQVMDFASLDINRDGRPDLIVTSTQELPSYVGFGLQVLINQGNGAFADETATRLPGWIQRTTGHWCQFIRLADFNGDGWEDFYCDTFWWDPGDPREWLNNGNGTWSPVVPDSVWIESVYSNLYAVDFEGDGRPDLLRVGGIVSSPDISYKSFLNRTPRTVPSEPIIGPAIAGNGKASVFFTTPLASGASPITSYIATCSPGTFTGAVTGAGTASPIIVAGLTNGRRYACSVTATSPAGVSLASGTVSVTPNVVIAALNPGWLRFSATKTSAAGALVSVTPPQDVIVNFAGAASAWTASANRPWVQITNGAGSGNGTFKVGITNPGNILGDAQTSTATVTIGVPGLNTTIPLPVTLIIQFGTIASAAPFGAFDTPSNNTTGLVGAIPVTGWALDDVGVQKIQLWRNCVETIDRPAGACASSAPAQPANFVYIGDAAFLAGARPDVEVANLGIPQSYRAGWGYLMSTNALPHLPTTMGAGGQGSFTLSAYAIDVEGQFTLLGTKSISIDNDHATIPFGVLDTPTQGGTITVSPYASFGWAMTQTPKCIDPTKITSYKIYIDGVSRPLVPSVNWFPGLTRPDIAAAYPGRCNTNTALAAYYIDANALGLSNGLHTTGWDVVDDKGNVAGIGSRFFNVLVGSGGAGGTGGAGAAGGPGGTADSVVARRFSVADTASDRPVALGHAADLSLIASTLQTIRVQIGGDEAPFTTLTPGTTGQYAVRFGAGGRMALDLGGPVDAGYQIAGDELRALPAGSTLDAAAGTFAWQPPVPFLGPFNLVFIGGHTRTDVVATIADPTMSAAVTMHIDTPANESTVSGGFVIAGWALDPQAAAGTGIDTLHVWAYRRDGVTPPQFLGAAAVGGLRPDVAVFKGEQFERSGFSLTTSSLTPGIYDILAYPWSHRVGAFQEAQSVRVTVH